WGSGQCLGGRGRRGCLDGRGRQESSHGTDCADGKEGFMTESQRTSIGYWRATYTPGSWIVLSGPTSMVVMQPAPASASNLLNSIWDVVVAGTSLQDVAERLAAFGLDKMPSF